MKRSAIKQQRLAVIDVDPPIGLWQAFRHVYAYDSRTRRVWIVACEHREAAAIEQALDTGDDVVIEPDDWQTVGITGRGR